MQENSFKRSVTINAPISDVWDALTRPELMQQWMFDNTIDIITDWQVGGPIIIMGDLHGHYFKNNGTVLEYQKEKDLAYDHRSSLSDLPDVPESYTTISFTLDATGNEVVLTATFTNFPTESIYKHFVFYWNGALSVLTQLLENEKRNRMN